MDAEEISQAINILLQDKKLGERLGSKWLEISSRKFNWGVEKKSYFRYTQSSRHDENASILSQL